MPCVHGKLQFFCKQCHLNGLPTYYCAHNIIKYRCHECKPATSNTICEHSRQKNQCRECCPDKYLELMLRNRIKNIIKKKQITPQQVREFLGVDQLDSRFFLKLLGVSDIHEFKRLFQYRLNDTPYTWENYGTEWELDHFLPLSTEKWYETLMRCHYSNIHPLTPAENKQKKNKEPKV